MSTRSGLFGIILLILGVLAFFFTLNYFNILSLSRLYPNLFSSLPHQPFAQKTVSKLPLPKPTPTPVLPAPKKLPNGLYSADAIFRSYTKTTTTLTLSDGVRTFDYDNKTALLNVDVFKKTNGTTQFFDADAFFKQIAKGDLIFVIYSTSKSALYAEQIQHMLPKK